MRRPSLRLIVCALLALLCSQLPAVPVRAAIGVTELLADSSTSNTTSYTTNIAGGFAADSTIQCASNALCLCAAASTDGGAVGTHTMTGGGQTTWTEVATQAYDTLAASTSRLTVFRSLGEAGTAAAITVDVSAAGTGMSVHCWQFTNVVTSGTNGSGAVTQADANASDSTNTIAPDGLAALGANHVLWQIGAAAASRNWTAQMDFTAGTEVVQATPANETLVQYLANGSDTTPTLTVDGVALVMATIAVEVAEAVAAGGARFQLLGVGP